jgi:hypothetical protein
MTNPGEAGGLDNPERDHLAAKMRRDGHSYKDIADKLGWANSASAHHAVQRAMKAIPKEPTRELIDMELARLNSMYVICTNILEAEHVTVSNGRLIFLNDVPLRDYGPILATLDRMLKIQERRAKIIGYDAPTKSRIEVITEDAMVTVMKDLEAQIAELDKHSAMQADTQATVDTPTQATVDTPTV